jgi:hypothetical protein
MGIKELESEQRGISFQELSHLYSTLQRKKKSSEEVFSSGNLSGHLVSNAGD